MKHHVEVFIEVVDTDGTRRYGWQCFNSDCQAVQGGYRAFAAAELAGDTHEKDNTCGTCNGLGGQETWGGGWDTCTKCGGA